MLTFILAMKIFLLPLLLLFSNNHAAEHEIQFVFSKDDCTSDNATYALVISRQTPDERLVWDAFHGKYEKDPNAYIWSSRTSYATRCKDTFQLPCPETIIIEIKPISSKKKVNQNTKFTVQLYSDVDLIMSVPLIPSQPAMIDLQTKTISLVFRKP